jgi:hypothetical protein
MLIMSSSSSSKVLDEVESIVALRLLLGAAAATASAAAELAAFFAAALTLLHCLALNSFVVHRLQGILPSHMIPSVWHRMQIESLEGFFLPLVDVLFGFSLLFSCNSR